MNTILERAERIRELGRGLLEALEGFPEGCREGLKVGEDLELQDLEKFRPRMVVLAGMGGSAICGLLLRDWLFDSKTPFYTSVGYHLPGFLDDETLVIAVSYSGNTDETLSAFEEAWERGCALIAATSNGRLKMLSEERGIPIIPLPTDLKPRASLPQQLFSIASVLKRIGIDVPWCEVDEALGVLERLKVELGPETLIEDNKAKTLAISLKGFIPFIYASRRFEGVAYRMRTQLNENSKLPASSVVLPEGFHNAVMSCEGPLHLTRSLAALIIRDPREEERIRSKIDVFMRLLEGRFGRVLELWTAEGGLLSRMLSAIYIGDYVSLYLSLLYGLDPSSTASIELLKRVG